MKPHLGVHQRNNLWLLLACVVMLDASGTMLPAQTNPSSPSNNNAVFAGSWEGACQDGKPFVLLTLRSTTDNIEGTISLGNVTLGNSPENKGGTCTATEPASAGHAMPIKHALVDGKKLTFESSRGLQIEMILDSGESAKLRFAGTSMEDTSFEIHKTVF